MNNGSLESNNVKEIDYERTGENEVQSKLHNNMQNEDNSAKINNNVGSKEPCCRYRGSPASSRSCVLEPSDEIDNFPPIGGDNDGLIEVDNQETVNQQQCSYKRSEESPRWRHPDKRRCENALLNRSNNLGTAGVECNNESIKASFINVRNEPTTSRSNDDQPSWNASTGEEDCDKIVRNRSQLMLVNNIPPRHNQESSTRACGCPVVRPEENHADVNMLNLPSTSRSNVGEGLWNNVWKQDVKKCPSKVRNGLVDEGGRWYTSSDEESWSGNEGEEECCVYTYKGSLQADLPSSFLTLDKIANGLDHAVDEERPEPAPPQRLSGASSPDNEFLEMDFDPGPSLDLDESEDQEMRASPVPELPCEQALDENDLSADNEHGEMAEIVANVEPQPGPSRGQSSPPPPPCRPAQLLASSPCPPALPHRGWSARDSWGHHCSSGDLCSPLSSGDAADTDSLALWNSTHNPTCGKAEGEGGAGDTRKYNLFSDLYHCIMAKRLVMEKNASFTEVKGDADSSPEDCKSPPVDRTMIWSEQEACLKQVTQISTSACGATAVINVMMALKIPFVLDKVKKGVNTRLRLESAPIPAYLQSRSVAGATHDDVIRGIETASEGRLYARFFHMHPERRFSLGKWLSYWMRKGAVPIATLNLQAGLPPGVPIPDAWHHQMIFGVSPRGVFLTNPLECVAEGALMPQLCSPSILKVKRSDVIQRWTNSCDLMPLFRPADVRWKQLNVLGQVVNVVRESMGGGSASRAATQHITIPAAYQSGITLVVPVDSPACQHLRDAPHLPLLLQPDQTASSSPT